MRKSMLILMALVMALFAALPAMAQEDQAEDQATFRVAHLSQDAGPVDIYVNGDVLLEAVEFGTISDWMSVPAGTYAVDIAPTGTSADDAVLSGDLTLEAGETNYTAAAIGFAERPDIAPLELQVITEDFSPINPAEARVTIFHAIPNADPVTVTADDTTLVEGLTYPGRMDEEADGLYTADVVAGTYDIAVALTESGTTIFDLPETTFTGNRHYFIMAAGAAEDPELILNSTNPDAMGSEGTMQEEMAEGPAQLRVAHFSEDAPAVDIYVNGEVALEGVEYPAMSDFLELEAGTYTVDVVPAGSGLDAAVLSADVTLAAGTSYTAAAIGLVSRPDIAPLELTVLETDYSEIAPAETRFSVFHASPGAPPVDVLVNGDVFVASLAYPNTLDDNDGLVTFDVVADTYDIQVTAAGDPDTVLLDLPGTELTAGNQYFIAAINSPDNINYFLTSAER